MAYIYNNQDKLDAAIQRNSRWIAYWYDNLRRLNQVDYAADSGFAQSSRSIPASEFDSIIEKPEAGTSRLRYLASYVLQWLDDGTIPVTEKENLAQRRKDAEKQNEYNITSVNSEAKLLTLAEFGSSESAESVKSVVPKTETVYDDNGKIAAQIVYDANGNMTLFAMYPDDGGKVIITSAYDKDGNMTSNICTTYDAKGNIVRREDMPLATVTTEPIESVIPAQACPVGLGAGIQSFSSLAKTSEADLWLMEADLLYSDSGMMLMSAPSGPATASEIFDYDHLGNRYQHTDKNGNIITYSHNTVNQYQHLRTPFGFGLEDNIYPSHDNNGNLSDDGYGYNYDYDYRNRLISINDGANTIAEYFYDALGRRMAKTVGNTTTLFYYNPNQQVIAEYEGTSPQLTREYVYGNSVGEILCMFFPQNDVNQEDFDQFLGFCEAWLSSNTQYDHNSDGKVDYKDFTYFATVWGVFPSNEESHYYYLTDALGSIRGLIGGKFNREEDKEFFNYDVYGMPSTTSVTGNPFMFAGYRIDPESGLYFTPYRIYDPQTGRWLQFDPILYGDSMNLCEYTKSSPIMYIDPFGLTTFKDVENGRAVYSCNCGWIDWGHATPGMGSHLDDITKEKGERSLSRNGFKVNTEMSHGKWFLKEGVQNEYFVSSGLTKEQQESVALGMLKDLAWEFETMQSFWYYKPFTDSGFSEEDLPSDLIGFYQKLRGFSKDDIKKRCQTLSSEESMKVWKETGGVKNYKPAWDDNHWKPRYHQSDSKTAKSACEKRNSPCDWPKDLKDVEPAEKGDNWDDWKTSWTDGDSYPRTDVW